MIKQHSPLVLVIGLDGATFDLMRPWVAEGKLPHIAKLMKEGTWGELESTIPPLSGPAWVSFMTGKNPGKHGVFHFRDLDFRQYDCFQGRLATSSLYADHSLFRILSRFDCRVGAVSVPMTYPPFRVNGFMISGYPTPDLHRAYTYPAELALELGEWHISDDQPYLYLPPDKRLEEAEWIVRRYTDFSLKKLSEEPFDLFMVVFNNIDMAHHLFWRFTDPEHPAYDPVEARLYRHSVFEQYRIADAAVGELVNRVGDNTTVVIMSDHGGGSAPTRYVHFNHWLKTLGLLSARKGQWTRERAGRIMNVLKEMAPRGIRQLVRENLGASATRRLFALMLNLEGVDWNNTQAYAARIDSSTIGIEVNLKGRQQEGIIAPRDYEDLVDEILGQLEKLTDPHNREKVVDKLWRRGHLYHGEHSERAPDIIASLQSDYTMGNGIGSALFGEVEIALLTQFSGTHRLNGIFIAWGKGVAGGKTIQGARIIDLAPTLLRTLDLPLSDDMDGKVLVGALDFSLANARPERVVRPDAEGFDGNGRDECLSESEEAKIIEALRGLGYID